MRAALGAEAAILEAALGRRVGEIGSEIRSEIGIETSEWSPMEISTDEMMSPHGSEDAFGSNEADRFEEDRFEEVSTENRTHPDTTPEEVGGSMGGSMGWSLLMGGSHLEETLEETPHTRVFFLIVFPTQTHRSPMCRTHPFLPHLRM